MKLDAVENTKSFVVLEISKIPQNDELKIKILVDQEEFDFVVKFSDGPLGIRGLQIPGKLQHLTLDYLYRTKDFFNLLFAVYEGEEVQLPQDFRCWEYPPGYISGNFIK